MKIAEMPISSDEKLAMASELRTFAVEMFEGKLGLNLDEVMYKNFLKARGSDEKLAISRASLDPRLNLSDSERTTMAKLLDEL